MEVSFPFPPIQKKPLWVRVGKGIRWFFAYQWFALTRYVYRQKLRFDLKQSTWIYTPLVDKAQKNLDYPELEQLIGEWRAEDDYPRDALAVLESSELIQGSS